MPLEPRLQVLRGDITTLAIDAIVNAANESLLGGGGVDGAIHRAAGPELLDYCRTLDGCKPGEAKLSPGFNLPARWIIHTVGPIWRGSQYNESMTLANCYLASLTIAKAMQFEDIAFPAISTGVYGYPLNQATMIAVETCATFIEDSPFPARIHFVCFTPDAEAAYHIAVGSHGPRK